MQQLQGSYGGDRSDTLAQIMGMDYDPQGQMAQMSNAMLQTGMSASTALKKEDAATYRQFLNQQFQMNESKRTRKQALEDDRRKRAQFLEDAARQRGEAVQDLQFNRTARLEDMLFQRQGSVEDRDFARQGSMEDRAAARAAAVEDRNFARGNVMADRDLAKRELKSKALGMRLGYLNNLDAYLQSMDPNDQTMAQEIKGITALRNRLLEDVFKGIEDDPDAMVAALSAMAGAGTTEAQTGSALGLLAGRNKKGKQALSPEDLAILKANQEALDALNR
jgi:hypothetical protein